MHVRDIMHTVKRNFAKWQSYGTGWAGETTLYLMTKEHNVDKCNQCAEFPCEKISSMLERSKEYQKRCNEVCTDAEYEMLEKAFFDKENNLKK